MQIRHSNAPDAPAPVGQYTHAVEVTGATVLVTANAMRLLNVKEPVAA